MRNALKSLQKLFTVNRIQKLQGLHQFGSGDLHVSRLHRLLFLTSII